MPRYRAAVKVVSIQQASPLSAGLVGLIGLDRDLSLTPVPGGTRVVGSIDWLSNPKAHPLLGQLKLPAPFDTVIQIDILGTPAGSADCVAPVGRVSLVWEWGHDARLRVSGSLALNPEFAWLGSSVQFTGAARELPFTKALRGVPQQPRDVIGYGISYSWAQADHALLCETLALSGSNTTDIEYMAMTPVPEHGYRAGGAEGLRSRYLSLLDEVRKRDELLIVSVVNDNMHIRKWLNSGHHDLKHFPQECDRACEIVLAAGPANQWVQIMAEIQTSQGMAFERKWAPRFREAGFKLIWNDGSRPKTTPAGYFTRSYHACRLDDLGNGENTLLIPDCGAAINAYTLHGNFNSGTDIDPNRAAGYAEAGRRAGRGVCIYSGTGIKHVPVAAIREIGRRAGVGVISR